MHAQTDVPTPVTPVNSFEELLLPSGPAIGPDYDADELKFSDWRELSVHWLGGLVPLDEPGVMTFLSRANRAG